MTDAPTPAPRERGWRRLLVALIAFLLVPMVPVFRAIIPVEQLFLLLIPAFAACTLVGWWAGGRLWLTLAWVGLAVWVLVAELPGASSYDALAKGWAVVLAASFGLICLATGGTKEAEPEAGRPFFTRALAAIALAFAVGIGLLVFTSGSTTRVRRVVETELSRRVDLSVARWDALSRTPEWTKFSKENPEVVKLAAEGERQIRALPAFAVQIYPALLGLESLAALALAWALYHRVSRVRIGPPLAPLKEFRFNDQLVWGVIAGITVLVLPTLAGLKNMGLNLLLFFGALYALRGFGVLTWFLAPGRLVMALLVGFAVVAWPLFGVFALGLGLGDTWLNWRSRARPTT